MVCVPCFIIPVLLVIWRLFIQPIILRFWNPWEKKDEKGNIINAGTEFPFQCAGGTCKFVAGGNKKNQSNEKSEILSNDDENKITTAKESKKEN